jgi:hypothetical protein
MEVNADIEFQRRAWIVQRIGWLVIAAVIVAALLGLFGGGPLSRAAVEGDGLRVAYERFARLQQSTRLQLALPKTAPGEVALNRGYLELFRIEQITPEPREVEANGEWLVYRFGGSGTSTVTFHLMPEKFGSVAGAARADGNPLAFHQFIYP